MDPNLGWAVGSQFVSGALDIATTVGALIVGYYAVRYLFRLVLRALG